MTKRNPFKYFKTSPEIIKLAVMYYVRFRSELTQVEDILHERGEFADYTDRMEELPTGIGIIE